MDTNNHYLTKAFKPGTVVVPYSKNRTVTVIPAINCDAENERGFVVAFSTGFRVFFSHDSLEAMGEAMDLADKKMEAILEV